MSKKEIAKRVATTRTLMAGVSDVVPTTRVPALRSGYVIKRGAAFYFAGYAVERYSGDYKMQVHSRWVSMMNGTLAPLILFNRKMVETICDEVALEFPGEEITLKQFEVAE